MNKPTSIKIGLLALSVLAILAALPASLLAEEAASPDEKTAVFYFHGNKRCMTCRSIESTASKAVKTLFAEPMKSGQLEWHVVNFEEKGNEHYVKELSLVGAGVVVAHVDEAGKLTDAKTLQKVWRLSSDEDGMRQYLEKEVTPYLTASK